MAKRQRVTGTFSPAPKRSRVAMAKALAAKRWSACYRVTMVNGSATYARRPTQRVSGISATTRHAPRKQPNPMKFLPLTRQPMHVSWLTEYREEDVNKYYTSIASFSRPSALHNSISSRRCSRMYTAKAAATASSIAFSMATRASFLKLLYRLRCFSWYSPKVRSDASANRYRKGISTRMGWGPLVDTAPLLRSGNSFPCYLRATLLGRYMDCNLIFGLVVPGC